MLMGGECYANKGLERVLPEVLPCYRVSTAEAPSHMALRVTRGLFRLWLVLSSAVDRH